MRRKDLKYYLKTVELRLKSIYIQRYYDSAAYEYKIQQRRKELLEKWNKYDIASGNFNPYFTTYFYFHSTAVFDRVYDFSEGFPTRLITEKEKNPLLPFYYGLVCFNCQENLELLPKIAAYSLEKALEDSGQLRFPYRDDYSIFGLKSPWISGLTQSLASSFFLRMYFVTQNKMYLDHAEKAFLPNTVPVEKNGVLTSTKIGYEWVEEYPSAPPSYVLNGHLFAIINALELFQITRNSNYKIYAEQWLLSCMHHLAEYQYGAYLLHNKFQYKLSNLEYQGLYVGLFKHLYELTKHPLLEELYLYYNDIMPWNRFNAFYGIKKRTNE